MSKTYTRLEFEALCRCCKTPVISDSQTKVESHHLSLYTTITSIPPKHQENLPKVLCPECAAQLVVISDFIGVCVKSCQALNAIAASQIVKTESIETVLVKVEILEDQVEVIDIASDGDIAFGDDLIADSLDNDLNDEVFANFTEKNIKTEDNVAVKVKQRSVLKSKVACNRKPTLENLPGDVKSSEKDVRCKQCKKWIKAEDLEAHINVHKKDNKCPICSREFKTPSYLQVHMKSHSDDRPYECPYCHQFYRRTKYLNVHIAHLHKGKPYQPRGSEGMLSCTLCDKKYKSPISMRNHVKIVHEGQPQTTFLCSDCGKSFTAKATLTEHMQVVHKNKRFLCPQCPKTLSSKGTLRLHLLMHTGIKPHACTLCDVKFYEKKKLIMHQKRVHDGEGKPQKTYSCTLCKSKFAYKYNLSIHMKRHRAEFSESCSYCQKEFVIKSELTRHVKKYHTQIKLEEPDDLS